MVWLCLSITSSTMSRNHDGENMYTSGLQMCRFLGESIHDVVALK